MVERGGKFMVGEPLVIAIWLSDGHEKIMNHTINKFLSILVVDIQA